MPYSSDIPFGSLGRLFGGRLYLTDRRLIFAPTNFETRIGGKPWTARLLDLEQAFADGSIRTVRVVTKDGQAQRFEVGQKTETAATIDAAIGAAKARGS